MYALPRSSTYIAKSKIVFPCPRTYSANNNMSSFSAPVFSAGDSSVSSGVQEHIAPRRIDRFLPRCFRRGCFLPRMELSPAKRPGQSAKCARAAPETSAVAKFERTRIVYGLGILRSLGCPGGPARGGIATDTAAMAPIARLAPQKRSLLVLSKTRTP